MYSEMEAQLAAREAVLNPETPAPNPGVALEDWTLLQQRFALAIDQVNALQDTISLLQLQIDRARQEVSCTRCSDHSRTQQTRWAPQTQAQLRSLETAGLEEERHQLRTELGNAAITGVAPV
jgi:hypothetical protein